jgi:citrate synthase
MAGQLKARLAAELPALRDEQKNLAKTLGETPIGTYTVGQLFGGMRGINALICDTSKVDPNTGLIIRGRPVLDLTDKLPEEIFYLLFTGDLPNEAQLDDLREDLAANSTVPDHVWAVLKALPTTTHPMSAFSTLVLAMQSESKTAKNYNSLGKGGLWEPYFDDGLRLFATAHVLAAAVYRHCFGKGERLTSNTGDIGTDYVNLLGLPDADGSFAKLMQLYLTLHSDHEGGNVSTATALTVASAHSDPYLAVSAGLNGLAGPLHGLANQQALNWLLNVQTKFTGEPSLEQIEAFAWETLNGGQVIPGYGHAVLRNIDPRYTAFRQFGLKYVANDSLFKLVEGLFQVVPAVLQKQGKASNPWPNVDAISGTLLYHYGLKEFSYYTVMFGVSRVMGFVAQVTLARAMNAPIMRPNSVTTQWVKDTFVK